MKNNMGIGPNKVYAFVYMCKIGRSLKSALFNTGASILVWIAWLSTDIESCGIHINNPL